MLNQPSKSKIWLLSLLTLGLYFFYWCSRSRADINSSAKQPLVPSCWYLVVPGLNYFWMWLYAEALQKVSYKRIKASDVFLVYVIGTSLIGLPWTLSRGFSYPSSATSTVHPTLHTVLLIIGIVVAVGTLVNAAGLAFFMSYTQGKISALPQTKRGW